MRNPTIALFALAISLCARGLRAGEERSDYACCRRARR